VADLAGRQLFVEDAEGGSRNGELSGDLIELALSEKMGRVGTASPLQALAQHDETGGAGQLAQLLQRLQGISLSPPVIESDEVAAQGPALQIRSGIDAP